MTTALVRASAPGKAAAKYIAASLADNTRRGYAADLRDWAEWCADNGVNETDPQPGQIADYFAALADAGMKYSTITHRRSALRKALSAVAAQEGARFRDQTNDAGVKATLQGVARVHGSASYQKKALVIADLRKVVALMDDSLCGRRDRALLTLLFAGAYRGSELLSLNREDVAFTGPKMTVFLRRSKTDQAGKGAKITFMASGDTTCPVEAMRGWLDASNIAIGPIFRRVFKNQAGIGKDALTIKALSIVVKSRTAAAGLAGDYSTHSGRRGFVTSALSGGSNMADVMKVTRHVSLNGLLTYNEGNDEGQTETVSRVMRS